MSIYTAPLSTDVKRGRDDSVERVPSPGKSGPSPLPLLPGASSTVADSEKTNGADADDDEISKQDVQLGLHPFRDTFSKAKVHSEYEFEIRLLEAGEASELWANNSVFVSTPNGVEVYMTSTIQAELYKSLVVRLDELTSGFDSDTTDSAGSFNSFTLLSQYIDLPLETMSDFSVEVYNGMNALSSWLSDGKPAVGVRRTGYNPRYKDATTGMVLNMAQQAHSTMLSFPELWISLYAANRGISPKVYAASLYGDWPIQIVEAGLSLSNYIVRFGIAAESFDAVGKGLQKCVSDASEAGILMCDIKPGNIVVMDEYTDQPRPLMIDFDPKYTGVVYKPSPEWVRCIRLINTVLLVRIIHCKFGGLQPVRVSRICAQMLVDLRSLEMETSHSELCDLLSTVVSPQTYRTVHLGITTSWKTVVEQILAMSSQYTNFESNPSRRYKFNQNNCSIDDFDPEKPVFPQLIKHALHIGDRFAST